MEARSDERLRRDGLDLPEDTVADLRRIGAEMGLPQARIDEALA
jgi:hypothetical protein